MHHVVFERRFTVPSLPPRHIPRPRLLSALDRAVTRPLTLVAAGPGSGKSVLLSDWAARRPTPVAWISLEPGDNVPSRFWAAVAGAFAAAQPAAAAPTPSFAVDTMADVVVPALERAEDRPLILVLDDAHLITDRTILSGLEDCLRRWGHRLRLVISARSDPLLPLHRYRLAGTLSEVRADALAMTDDESAHVLAAHGVTLSATDFARLTNRTEGWAAGVRLSAMSMEGAERASDFVTEFALDRGSVGEYLMDEVLDRQRPEVKRLLIETSFLREVNGSIAQAVTGLEQAPDILRELARTNSFVLPVDRGAGTYRYHHLLGEILRFLLRHGSDERRRECLRRAAAWYGTHGDVERALGFAAEANDLDHAARIVVCGGLAQILSERLEVATSTAERLVENLPDDPARRSMRVLAAAALFALSGRPGCAQRWLDEHDPLPTVPSQTTVTEQLVELLIARGRLQVGSAQAVVERLMRTQHERLPQLVAAAQVELAMTHFYGGDSARVEPLLTAAREVAHAHGLVALERDCLAQLAHVNAFWGRFPIARKYERAANLLIRQAPGLELPAALVYATAARHFSAARFASADDAITRCASAHTDERDHDLRSEIVLLEAMHLSVNGRPAAAHDRAETTRSDTGGLVGDFRMFVIANVDVALGRPERALTVLADHAPDVLPDLISVASARALLAVGDIDEAASMLRPIVAAPPAQVHRPILIDALLADVEVARTRDVDEERAVTTLLRAISLAADDFVVPFVRTSRTLDDLRSRHGQVLDHWPVSDEPVLAVLPMIDVASVEAITDRERAVLRWLSTTMSTVEIADELCLSVNTVKTHIAAIYRKLGATRRRNAVDRAREFELL